MQGGITRKVTSPQEAVLQQGCRLGSPVHQYLCHEKTSRSNKLRFLASNHKACTIHIYTQQYISLHPYFVYVKNYRTYVCMYVCT
jgi:hypothetical protein